MFVFAMFINSKIGVLLKISEIEFLMYRYTDREDMLNIFFNSNRKMFI